MANGRKRVRFADAHEPAAAPPRDSDAMRRLNVQAQLEGAGGPRLGEVWVAVSRMVCAPRQVCVLALNALLRDSRCVHWWLMADDAVIVDQDSASIVGTTVRSRFGVLT